MDRLKFSELREANMKRLPLFRDAKGRICHKPDGSDWTYAQWLNAATGELGELSNLIKKIDRGDFTVEELRDDLGREAADVVTYLDILMNRLGIDYGLAVRNKFNEVSDRVGCDVKLSTFKITRTG